ncbi:MAG TPA: hypothetical protein VIG70_17080 [Burkholderiales bacterium]|jgi:hypothetical protein
MLRNLLLAGLAVLVFVSCGGGDDEEEPPPNRGHLTIGNPSADAVTVAPSETTIELSGTAFNASFFFNCFFGTNHVADIGVSVTWNNAAGGSGTASQSVGCCSITGTGGKGWLCALHGGSGTVGDHNWSASIPIIPGTNVVTMTASDSSGNVGRDTITITR